MKLSKEVNLRETERIQQRENTAREKIEQWFELAYKHGGLWISPGKIEDETRKLSMTGAKSIFSRSHSRMLQSISLRNI